MKMNEILSENQWNRKIKERVVATRPWYNNALQLVKDVSTNDSKITEFGCGNGEFGNFLYQEKVPFKTYLGLDGYEASLKIAESFGLNVMYANFEQDMPTITENTDVAISLEVIEHIADAEGFVLKIAKSLKNGGYLILSTPNIGFWRFRLKYLLRAEVPQEGIHLRFFNKKLLIKTLESAGFKLIKKKSITPAIINNIIGKIFKRERKVNNCPLFLEPLLGLHFIWLLQKK